MNLLICLIPLLPFLAFLANGLGGKWLKERGGWLATACMGASALIGVGIFIQALTAGEDWKPIQVTLWKWMEIGGAEGLNVTIGFRVDQLTALMLSFVTFVSTLVFMYSIGYMHGDRGFNRFFAWLSLFAFSMLILVLADSLPLLFVGWEGVGLCSYLLIGFYMDMPGAPDAGRKAFIMNRIGDLGVLIAMFMLFYVFRTLNIQEIVTNAIVVSGNSAAQHHALMQYGAPFVTVLTLMLFLGCTGKSAQIPLFTWLPDAMAGPTPVSALIHAATMVTAGIYLIVRLSVLFALAPATMLTIALVAAATAFVAGSIALTQKDIKKVLAYSTVSQLGYMFLACGVGAFTAGIFHVFTHAFFKACLFLGAGSVIHACHHIQNMDKMGGLRRKMPITSKTFLIGCLGLAGIFPLAGFMSKDEILWEVFSGKSPLHFFLYMVGLVTALFTACYAFRAYFMTFEGESRLPHDVAQHVHESPHTMTIPLIVLAAGTVLAGFLNIVPGLGHIMHMPSAINDFLAPIVTPAQSILAAAATHEPFASTRLEIALMLISTVVAVAGILLARSVILRNWPERAAGVARGFGPGYRLSANRWWWDDIYMNVFGGGLRVVAAIVAWFDRWIVDGLIDLMTAGLRGGSYVIRWAQNGQVQAYALAIVVGVNIVLALVWFAM